jgi:Flp pilus assembly protein TadD
MTKVDKISPCRMVCLAGIALLVVLLTACSGRQERLGGDPFLSDRGIVEEDIRESGSNARPHDNARYRYQFGRYLQDRNKHAMAVTEFRTLLDQYPGHADAYNAMGISLDRLGRHREAIAAYEEALKINPKRADIANNRGYSHLLDGNSGLAVDYLQKAVFLDSKNKHYRGNLTLVYIEEEEYDEALKSFRRIGYSATESRTRLAEILRGMGRNREAEEQLRAAGTLEEINRQTNSLYNRQ